MRGKPGKVREDNKENRNNVVWHTDTKIWTSCLPEYQSKDAVWIESPSKAIQNFQLEPAPNPTNMQTQFTKGNELEIDKHIVHEIPEKEKLQKTAYLKVTNCQWQLLILPHWLHQLLSHKCKQAYKPMTVAVRSLQEHCSCWSWCQLEHILWSTKTPLMTSAIDDGWRTRTGTFGNKKNHLVIKCGHCCSPGPTQNIFESVNQGSLYVIANTKTSAEKKYKHFQADSLNFVSFFCALSKSAFNAPFLKFAFLSLMHRFPTGCSWQVESSIHSEFKLQFQSLGAEWEFSSYGILDWKLKSVMMITAENHGTD